MRYLGDTWLTVKGYTSPGTPVSEEIKGLCSSFSGQRAASSKQAEGRQQTAGSGRQATGRQAGGWQAAGAPFAAGMKAIWPA